MLSSLKPKGECPLQKPSMKALHKTQMNDCLNLLNVIGARKRELALYKLPAEEKYFPLSKTGKLTPQLAQI